MTSYVPEKHGKAESVVGERDAAWSAQVGDRSLAKQSCMVCQPFQKACSWLRAASRLAVNTSEIGYGFHGKRYFGSAPAYAQLASTRLNPRVFPFCHGLLLLSHPALSQPCALAYTRRFIVFRQLSAGFTSNSEAKAHGSILMVSAILKHGGSFMMPRFDETCVAVMDLKDKHGQ